MANVTDAFHGRVCTKQMLNRYTIRNGAKDVTPTKKQTDSAQEWLSDLDTGRLVNEQQNHPRFLNRILVDVLGYDEGRIRYEQGTGGNINRKPDFTIMSGSDPLCFVEVKGSSTGLFDDQGRSGDRKTPFSQLQDQIINSAPRPKYGIVSNYNDFLLMTLEGGTKFCQRFTFDDMRDNPDTLAEFIWMFGHLVRDKEVESLHKKSIDRDNEITEKFYEIFNDLRLTLIRWFGDGGITEDAILFTQTFLNRLVFVLFAEDLNLAPSKIREILSELPSQGTNTTSMTFDAILDVFTDYEKGARGVPRFNGGLFAEPFDRNMRIYDKKDNKTNPVIAKLEALAKYNFETEVSVDILGHIFEQSISDIDRLKMNETRSKEGVYYTPEHITDYICRNTIIPYLSESGNTTTPEGLIRESKDLRKLQDRLQSIKILDPACGSGAFLTKSIDVLLEIHDLLMRELIMRGVAGDMDQYTEATRIRTILQNNIYGVDISEASAGITKLSIFLKIAQIGGQLPDLSGTIKTGNSLVWDNTGERHFDWHTEFPEVFAGDQSGFDVIIGNPPYIKQARLDNKPMMQLPIPNDLGYDSMIDSKADISVYFFIHALNILKPGGLLGFINTDSWLHFKYGEQLQAALLRYCDTATMVRPKTKIFPDAQIRTVVTIARRSDTHTGCLAGFSSDFDCIPKEIRDVKPGNWLGLIHEGVLPEPQTNMTTLGEICDITSGIETGHDAFYVLGDEDVTSHRIDKKYLVPILTKPVEGHAIYETSPHRFLLHVQDHEGTLIMSKEGKRVKRYIDNGNPGGKAKKDKPRYHVRVKSAAPILVSMQINEKVRVYENVAKMSALRKFTYVTPKKPEYTTACLAYLSSSYFALYQEVWGHPMGGGLLKFQIGDYNTAPIPDFSGMSLGSINRAWESYKESLNQDMLDEAVFDALGISGHMHDVKKSLSDLVADRLAAAKM